MPSKKIGLELSRNEAIAVAEALASCGDSQAEHVALMIRNELGDLAEAREYYWTNNSGLEFKLYQEAGGLPIAFVRNDDSGEWDAVIDTNEWSEKEIANGPERPILIELMINVLGGDESSEEDDEE